MRYKRCVTFALVASGLFVSSSVFATSYSYNVDVQFNFNSKLGVTITDADIKILDLAPGTSADSNIVGITISTNNVAGYTAEATVGNAQNATTNMTHTNGTNTFTSIATDASQASLSTDNTWGYAISTDNGTSWSNFSGLPIYTADGKQLASTDSPASDAIQFKINAKASTSQPAGDYTNVINFKVVANVPPRTFEDVFPSDYCTTHPSDCDSQTNQVTIQNINGEVCESIEAYDTQFQATDSRDHKNYWISKLRDGHCWMTQNLDLDLDSTKTYTYADTDLGYGSDRETTSWSPERSTIATSSISGEDTVTGWSNQNYDPYSVDPGDWYWTDTWYGYDEEASDRFASSPYPGNGTHGHIGNFYNWTAAIASNDSSSYQQGTYSDISNNPQNSICPANWRLPTISGSSYTQGTTNEFYRLTYLYANNTSLTSNSDDQDLVAAPLYFVRGGWIGNDTDSTLQVGRNGEYWSSTIAAASGSYWLHFSHNYIGPTSSSDKYNGMSIRCVARDPEITITRAYELAYTANHKGMYVKAPNENTYHEMQPNEQLPSGTDTRFAMQDIDMTYNNTKVCDLVTVIGDQYQAVDTRDWKLYYISKLKDGKCWMTQNLALDLSTNKTLTPADSDLSANWTPGVSTDDNVTFDAWWQSVRDYCADRDCNGEFYVSMPAFSKSFDSYYWNGEKEGTSIADNLSSTGNPHYRLGNYYTFQAAVAYNDVSSIPTESVINQSICPNGWRIPDASMQQGSAGYLSSLYQTTGQENAPVYYMPTSYYGFDAYSTSISSGFVPYLTLNETTTNHGYNYLMRYFQPMNAPMFNTSMWVPHYLGIPIRCIAR